MRSRLAVLVLVALSLPANPAAAQPAAKPAAPWWLGSTAGVSDEVLAPWTPVEVAAGKVSVWGRRYEFDSLPFPSSVVTRGEKVLAGPITLRGTAGGRELDWTAEVRRTVESRPALARLATAAEAGPLRCEGTTAVEYDGMVRCDFKLVPAGGKATVERLVLEMPLDPRYAKYLHFWPGRWGSAFNSAALPKDGYRGPFRPLFWLGDERRGLAWFSESDRNFFNAQGDRVIEIEPREGRVVFRVNLITTPQTIDKPLAYTFGFQATPVGPARPDAWDYRICHMGAYGVEDRPYKEPGGKATTALEHLAQTGVRTMCFHEQWTDIQAYPATTHGKELKKLVDACHKEKIQLLLYHGYEMSTIAPEWNEYHEKCLVFPRRGGYKRKYQPEPDQTAYIVCYRSVWQDFIAAHLQKTVDEYGIDGVYLDGTSEPWGCRNTAHGCGTKRPDGSIGETFPIYDTRQMMKRIYTIVKRHDPKGQVNVHQSTCMTIPTLAFATSYWDGEHLQSVKRQPTAGEVLPLDAFRAEFMGHNWGVPAELLHYASGPLRRSESMALAFLHDVPVRPSTMADVDQIARLWRAFDELGRHEAAWLPYWENGRYVRTGQAGVKASLYNRPGKGFLAVIANTGPKECRAEVTFDTAALEQPGELVARDVLTGKELAIKAGRLELPLESLGFVVLRAAPN